MPKLCAFSSRQIIQLLEQNGFRLRRSSGSHFIFANLITKRRVVVPFHNKDIPKGTLHAILKQAGISKSELTER